MLPFDLHVLGLPPAFNLSHDQTLQFKIFKAQNPTTYFQTPHLKLMAQRLKLLLLRTAVCMQLQGFELTQLLTR